MTDKWNGYPFAVKLKTVVSTFRITGDVTKYNLPKYNLSTIARYFTKNSHFLLCDSAQKHIFDYFNN